MAKADETGVDGFHCCVGLSCLSPCARFCLECRSVEESPSYWGKCESAKLKIFWSNTAEQAAFENVPLSGLEKRMMYFTETGECPENPIALNNAFEDTTTYEKKISLLMAQAYRRD
jgi:hypothetical protein